MKKSKEMTQTLEKTLEPDIIVAILGLNGKLGIGLAKCGLQNLFQTY